MFRISTPPQNTPGTHFYALDESITDDDELFLWYGWPTISVSLISSRDHCQRSSPSQISDTPRAGFEPAQNLSSGFIERSCAVVITTAPRHHGTLARCCHLLMEKPLGCYLISLSLRLQDTVQPKISAPYLLGESEVWENEKRIRMNIRYSYHQHFFL